MGVNKLINDNIITTLNYLSNVELTINIPLLKTICDLFNNDSWIQKLIYTNLHPDTSNLFRLKSGGLKNKSNITKILEYNSKYYQDSSVLYTALTYSLNATENFSLFLPYFIDFRGRFYPVSGYLSPQSCELSRSLLVFKRKVFLITMVF